MMLSLDKRIIFRLYGRNLLQEISMGPKIRNGISVSKRAAVSHSDCWIFVIFTYKQLFIYSILLIKHFKTFLECRKF